MRSISTKGHNPSLHSLQRNKCIPTHTPLPANEWVSHQAKLLHLCTLLLGQVFHGLLWIETWPSRTAAAILPLILPRLQRALKSLQHQHTNIHTHASTQHGVVRCTPLLHFLTAQLVHFYHVPTYPPTHLVFPGRNLSNYDSLILNLHINPSDKSVTHHKVLSPEF